MDCSRQQTLTGYRERGGETTLPDCVGRGGHCFYSRKKTSSLFSFSKRKKVCMFRKLISSRSFMAASNSSNSENNPTCNVASPVVKELVQKTLADLSSQLTRMEEGGSTDNTDSNIQPYKVLECSSCEGFMNRPVCLPCGHTLCKSCIERPSDRSKTTLNCTYCGQSFPRIPTGFQNGRSPTVVLQTVSEKWYPKLLECCSLREEGNKLANEKNQTAAIDKYTLAIERGVIDHRLLSNRCKVYFDNGDLHLALQDAELCCSVRPYWAKGHYRRGVVLERLNRLHEAAGAFMLCLALGSTDVPVLNLTHTVISRILDSSGPSSDPKELSLSIVLTSTKQLEGYTYINAQEYRDDHYQSFDKALLNIADFDCVLCGGLLYKPVTVPCGHSFCQNCLARNFDHTPYCPICRSPLCETFRQHTDNSGRISVDVIEERLLELCFPVEYNEKGSMIEMELLKASRIGLHDDEALPIFVCTMAFPGIPCPLHIFEPRYRLMMRRCIESNSRRFGMCLPMDDQATSYADYGTVLFISSLEYTPDGRSLVSTIGERRFRVLERNTADGYAMARIQFISDIPVTGEDNIAKLHALQQTVYNHAMKWFNALPHFTKLMIIKNACVPPPAIDQAPELCPNGPAWVWWFINAVPTAPLSKLAFLCSVSLTERLLMLQEALPLPANTS